MVTVGIEVGSEFGCCVIVVTFQRRGLLARALVSAPVAIITSPAPTKSHSFSIVRRTQPFAHADRFGRKRTILLTLFASGTGVIDPLHDGRSRCLPLILRTDDHRPQPTRESKVTIRVTWKASPVRITYSGSGRGAGMTPSTFSDLSNR